MRTNTDTDPFYAATCSDPIYTILFLLFYASFTKELFTISAF